MENSLDPSSTPYFQTLRGFHDILPDDSDYYTLIKKVVRHRGRQAGFRRISTPILEASEVFTRGIGDTSEIVQKEMFSMLSHSGKSMSLKPEGTAGVVRSYIEHGMMNLPQPVQLYYIEPHFRYDRPQKGRYRQFHQFGLEVIGGRDPSIDAQVILLAQKILADLQIADRFTLQINTIGNMAVRDNYNNALRDYFYGKERHLTPELLVHLEKNPLRLFDTKDEDLKILLALAPKLQDFLDAESRNYYDEIKSFLTEMRMPFVENTSLVRGLDYYTDIVFEFWDKHDGAQNAIGGGGRYDGLVELMGGRATPATGAAFGVERIIAHMKDAEVAPPRKDKMHVFVAQLGGVAKKKAVRILSELHDAGVHAIGAVGKASMKYQLELANKFDVDWAVLLGEIEVKDNTAILRNMRAGTQEIMPLPQVTARVVELVGPENLDTYRIGE